MADAICYIFDVISFFLMWKCQNIKNKLFIYILNDLKNFNESFQERLDL